ncbi:hypothetical protein DPMN_101284 [Dreissena polymorpha]|uniref:Uncharacterized protein n=1 Tax=Dreissena polymorpha TaxID=45954 RepID=A0A9D4R867_DREPO|nr:hypothetical protein DPMN_101284 [Dreissena polymorpha]
MFLPMLTRKTARPPGSLFDEDWTINVASIFLTSNIIGTNLLTKFHDDRTINVASRVNKAPPPGGHVFQPTQTIFKLVQDIIRMNQLTKKNAPPAGRHVFQPIGIIFELVQDIIGMNLLTKFHKDWTINGASRVLTRRNAPPLGSYVFQANVTIFELIEDIIETNHLTNFHEDWTINVASRVKNGPPSSGHVFQSTKTILEFIQDIIRTTFLTKVLTRKNATPRFHEDQTINVASKVLKREMARPLAALLLINVASRVFTRKNARPPGGHIFQPIETIFKVIKDIIHTHVLEKKNAPPLAAMFFNQPEPFKNC